MLSYCVWKNSALLIFGTVLQFSNENPLNSNFVPAFSVYL
jgi:hypothetical protein